MILAEARIALAKADANAEVDASGAIARENRAKLASALDEECDVQLARRAAAAATLEETRALFDEVRSKSAHLDLRKQIIRDDANNEIERKIEEARELLAACDTREDSTMSSARRFPPDGSSTRAAKPSRATALTARPRDGFPKLARSSSSVS